MWKVFLVKLHCSSINPLCFQKPWSFGCPRRSLGFFTCSSIWNRKK